MSETVFTAATPDAATTVQAARIFRPALLALAAAALLAGCATQRDSITVGAIPDDYRTNHPIVIAEKRMTLDLPVGASDRGVTKIQKVALEGFLAGYDRSAAPVLTIMTPVGSANELAATMASRDFVRLARKAGVPAERVMPTQYQAESIEISSPVRIAYIAMRAQTDQCGRWPEDILDSSENKHYANFGCSYQNNLAAQIANPADLLGPRKPSPIDAENRNVVIDNYRNPTGGWSTTTNY